MRHPLLSTSMIVTLVGATAAAYVEYFEAHTVPKVTTVALTSGDIIEVSATVAAWEPDEPRSTRRRPRRGRADERDDHRCAQKRVPHVVPPRMQAQQSQWAIRSGWERSVQKRCRALCGRERPTRGGLAVPRQLSRLAFPPRHCAGPGASDVAAGRARGTASALIAPSQTESPIDNVELASGEARHEAHAPEHIDDRHARRRDAAAYVDSLRGSSGSQSDDRGADLRRHHRSGEGDAARWRRGVRSRRQPGLRHRHQSSSSTSIRS